MPLYKFDDIAENLTAKRKPNEADMQTYIGLEHLESGSLFVHSFGSDVPIKGDKLIMTRGDILLGKRNAYLKRAAIAPHDGLFSAHGMILRPKEKVIDKSFFPFFIASDVFFDEAIRISVGSLSPTINWRDLKEIEFNLPPLEEQRKLADLLWAAYDLKESYKRLLAVSDEMAKSQFVEMFGDLEKNPHQWNIAHFDEFALIDAQMTTDYEKYANYPHIGIDSIEKGSGILSGYRTVKEDNVISGKYIFTEKHIIYSKIRPNLNKVALPSFSGLCSADAYPILPKETCSRTYLAFIMRSDYFLRYIVPLSGRSNMPKVNREQIRGFSMPLPPLALQNEFAAFIEQLDKSKVTLQKSTTALDDTIKTILNKNLAE